MLVVIGVGVIAGRKNPAITEEIQWRCLHQDTRPCESHEIPTLF
jgi:hypothetical protein